jgi:hypothetical protein
MSPFGMPCVVGDAFDDEHAPRLIASPATMATATARRTEFQGREMVGVVHVHELAQQLAAEPGHRPEQALGQPGQSHSRPVNRTGASPAAPPAAGRSA